MHEYDCFNMSWSGQGLEETLFHTVRPPKKALIHTECRSNLSHTSITDSIATYHMLTSSADLELEL